MNQARLPLALMMAMPTVFVVPPEEDHAPPWCFFDAKSIPDDSPDDSDVIEVVRVARRTTLDDEHDACSLRTLSEDKPSSTLRSRASKVFKSLRGSLRSSRPRVQDVSFSPPPLPTSHSLDDHEHVHHPTEGIARRPRTPTISRRGSRVLSQLFSAPPLQSRPSTSSFDDFSPSADTDALSSPPVSPASDFVSSSSRCSSLYNAIDLHEARINAPSPTPTTTSFKTSRRRFSMLSLQRLFSFSATPTPSTAVPMTYDEPGEEITMSASDSSPSAASSLSSISVPQTPTSTEEVNTDRIEKQVDPTDLQIFDSLDSVFEAHDQAGLGLAVAFAIDSGPTAPARQSTSGRRSFSAPWNFSRPLKPSSKSPTQEQVCSNDLAETSFEMRLDSLHFDSLSFDADRF